MIKRQKKHKISEKLLVYMLKQPKMAKNGGLTMTTSKAKTKTRRKSSKLSAAESERLIDEALVVKKKPGRPRKIPGTEKPSMLENIAKEKDNPELPRVIKGKKVYARKVHGIIWNPHEPKSLERICKTITAFFLAGMNEKEVALAMDVRLDVLRGWIARFPEIKRAKDDGTIDVKSGLMNKSIKVANGYYYTEEAITKGGTIPIKRFQQPDSKMLMFLLQNMFRGKISQKPDVQNNTQFNIYIAKGEENV